jgi:hypothetical protein
MAYYIFLKSLRSLEEFRKNPHVKILPKSSSTIFQSLAKFKNPILIRKSFYFLFLTFGPAGLPSLTGLGLPAGPNHRSTPRPSSAQPSRPARQWRISQNAFPFSHGANRR